MKGQAKSVEIIGIIIAILMLGLGAMLLPNFINQIMNEYARGSGEYVARELSGLITLMRAPEHGIIYYQLPDIATYDINFESRVIEVFPKLKITLPIAKNTRGISYVGIEIQDKKIENVSELKIVKNENVVIEK